MAHSNKHPSSDHRQRSGACSGNREFEIDTVNDWQYSWNTDGFKDTQTLIQTASVPWVLTPYYMPIVYIIDDNYLGAAQCPGSCQS